MFEIEKAYVLKTTTASSRSLNADHDKIGWLPPAHGPGSTTSWSKVGTKIMLSVHMDDAEILHAWADGQYSGRVMKDTLSAEEGGWEFVMRHHFVGFRGLGQLGSVWTVFQTVAERIVPNRYDWDDTPIGQRRPRKHAQSSRHHRVTSALTEYIARNLRTDDLLHCLGQEVLRLGSDFGTRRGRIVVQSRLYRPPVVQ
jgi:hypothetical protein